MKGVALIKPAGRIDEIDRWVINICFLYLRAIIFAQVLLFARRVQEQNVILHKLVCISMSFIASK